jgi:quinol monooxygenase YgiN
VLAVPYRHVVLFRFHDTTTAQQRQEVHRALQALGAADGVLEWRVEESLDDRKGHVLIEDATFASREAFESFRSSAEHRAATEVLAPIADWLVGDYEA